MVELAGVGRHVVAVAREEPSKLRVWAKLLVVIEFVYVTAFTLPKLTILGIYMRIFTTRPYRIAVYVLASIIIANMLTAIFMAFSVCQPFAYSWDKTIPGGRCVDLNKVSVWIPFPNILTDAAMLVLPLPLVWRLHITRNQKSG